MENILNYINGQLVAPPADQWLDNYNPATGEVYSQIPDSDQDDVHAAVKAAEDAFSSWSRTPPLERSQVLERIADGLETFQNSLAQLESQDNGKPLWLAKRLDIPRAATNFRFFASALQHFASETHFEPGILNYTLRQPLGVVSCISPWNLPLYLLTWKIAPALATGNCVVAKPSEVTPMTAYELSKICQEAGLPPGVLNIVHGRGPVVGQAMTRHPAVKAVSFTGSTQTGAEIARVAAPQFKKLSLEMGGKNAALIFADCDYEKMLETVLRSGFANQGQICLCTSRLLVERSIYERFKSDLVEQVQTMKVGDPLEPETQQGALVSKAHQEKVLSFFPLAEEEGGRILCGGQAVQLSGRCENGWFVAPTVIEGLGPQCQTNQEEIFGPVVTLQPFETEQEALALANSTDYGLIASVWTSDISRSQRLAASLEAGVIWINTWMQRDLRTPFGGVKNSGLGREGGWEAFRFFTEPKNVCIQY